MKSKGEATVIAQLCRYYNKIRKSGQCDEIWWEDFKEELQQWYEGSDHIIVVGDFNEVVKSNELRSFFPTVRYGRETDK